MDNNLEKQHRNTKHDSIEKIQEVRSRYAEIFTFPPATDQMFNEMCGAIMNLRIRKPKKI